jgi:hypothetical protein
MNWVNRAMAALLRRSMQVMPAERRDWAEAVWSEAAEVPSGWRQLRWLAGGLRMIVLETALARRMRYPLIFAAAAAGTAWSAWSGPPGNAAATINRVDVIAMVVILATLPWIVGRTCGPVSRGRLARLVRTGGYAAILALVLVRTAVRRVADAPPNNLGGATSAWAGEIAYLAVMAGYVALILAVTARRSPADRATVATSVAAGMALGVMAYALGPLGFPLRFAGPGPASLYDAAMGLGFYLAVSVPLAAGLAAGRRSEPAGSGVRPGLMAGLIIGAAAALVVAVLSTATIALLPYDAWLRQWASNHIGHWTPVAGQWGPVLGPGTRQGYVAGNSAFAAGYLIVLLLAPLLGCALGAWGARSWRLLTR